MVSPNAVARGPGDMIELIILIVVMGIVLRLVDMLGPVYTSERAHPNPLRFHFSHSARKMSHQTSQT